jgi:peptide/nickel transport system ATP-binding protein
MQAPVSKPLLQVQGLVKHFPLKKDVLGRGGGVVRAVDDVNFQVLPGETLGVVGESGCGKSTTARLLMQLIDPTAGEVIFDGAKVGSRDLPLKEYRRQVQMVFQDSYASLNPRLTIEDSIAFGPQVHGVSTAESVARARALLNKVGLEPSRFGGRYPHELSGGQRQRAGAAATHRHPRRGRLRARQERRSPGAEPAARPEGRVRPHLRLHQPRPARGALHLRPRDGDVPR